MNPARSSALLVASGLASAVTVVLLAPFLIHHLGIEAYGIWVLAVSVGGLFTMADIGVGGAVSRLVAHARARGQTHTITGIASAALVLRAAQTLVLAGIAWLFVPRLAEHLATESVKAADIGSVLRLTIAVGVISGLTSVLTGVLTGSERFGTVAAIKLISTVGLAPAAVVTLATGGGLVELAAASLGLGCLSFLAVAIGARRAVGRRLLSLAAIDRATVRRLFAFGIPRQWSYVSLITSVYYERLMIGVLVGATAAGYFGPASALVAGLTSLFIQAISPATPMLTRVAAADGREAVAHAYRRVLRSYAVVVAGTYGLLAATAVPLMHVWLGSDFGGDTPRYVQLLAVGFALRLLAEPGFAVAQAVGRPRIEGIGARAGIAVLVPLGPLLLATLGSDAAAVATAASLAVATITFYAVLARRCPDLGALTANLRRPCAAAAGLALAFALANDLAAVSDSGRPLSFAVAAAEAIVFTLAYAALVGPAARPRPADLTALFRSAPRVRADGATP